METKGSKKDKPKKKKAAKKPPEMNPSHFEDFHKMLDTMFTPVSPRKQ